MLAIVRRLLRVGREASEKGNGVCYAFRYLATVSHPDRKQLHHRLLEIGMSHRGAVMALYVLGAVMATFALAQVAIQRLAIALLLAGTLAGLMLCGVVAYHWSRASRKRRSRPADTGGGPLLRGNLGPRHRSVVEDPR